VAARRAPTRYRGGASATFRERDRLGVHPGQCQGVREAAAAGVAAGGQRHVGPGLEREFHDGEVGAAVDVRGLQDVALEVADLDACGIVGRFDRHSVQTGLCDLQQRGGPVVPGFLHQRHRRSRREGRQRMRRDLDLALEVVALAEDPHGVAAGRKPRERFDLRPALGLRQHRAGRVLQLQAAVANLMDLAQAQAPVAVLRDLQGEAPADLAPPAAAGGRDIDRGLAADLQRLRRKLEGGQPPLLLLRSLFLGPQPILVRLPADQPGRTETRGRGPRWVGLPSLAAQRVGPLAESLRPDHP
jgi:hypothetical protein